MLETLARVVGDALSPLADRLQGEQAEQVLEQLGMRLPAGALAGAAIPQRLSESAHACAQLPPAVAALVEAVQNGDEGGTVAAALQLALRIGEAGAAFTELGTAIDGAVQAAAGLTPDQRARLRAAAAELPERLLHLTLIAWIEERQPTLKGGLELAGLFDDVLVPDDPTDPTAPPFRLKRVRFDRLQPLLSDPAGHLSGLYGFGTPGFDGIELFRRLKQLLDGPDFEAILIEAPGQPPVLEAFFFRLAVEPAAIPGLLLRVRIPAEKDLEVTVPLGGPWSSTVSSSARFEGGIELRIHPRDGLRIQPPTAAASVDVAVGLRAENGDGSPMILIGQAGSSRFELQHFAGRLPLRLSASTGAPSPQVSLGAELELKGGKIVIDASQADGFIGTILGGQKVEGTFELGAAYDTENGLRFTGSATIEIAIPCHLELGPLKIPALYLIGGFREGTIPLEFSADLGFQLGPLSASVNRLGAQATISFPAAGGNAGIVQIDVAFKPPNGVGLAVDAGVVKGGGYLFLDPDRGEYAGALELVFSEWIALKAIGLINTKMPDGSKGFSLLIIITVEFGTGIQLGFGFTLIGVGGLLGLHRIAKVEPLTEGVRTGAINAVMFPENVIANAPRIISDLRRFFPPQQDVFLVGPMAKIGWGTPTLVSVTIGVILEFPSVNITILGVIRVVLPDENADVLRLQVNFIGRIEPSNKRLWFYAQLFDSRVLFITIEGGFGLLVAWGDKPNFVISAGGFHPRYDPPALPFPEPPRIAVSLLSESYARVRIEGYFAVTSNSVQFGARAELFFGVSEFNIEGHLAFDALFQFDPFFFSFSLSVSLSVTVFGVGLFSVGFSGLLEGPTPWFIQGKGRIRLLFFKISVPFEHSWGRSQDTTLDSIAVRPLLEKELHALTNWQAEVPSNNRLLVSLRKLGEDDPDGLVLHPVGRLLVSQRKVPVNFKLDKVGNQKVADYEKLVVGAVLPGGAALAVTRLEEPFAIGQFRDLDASSKLSSPGFEPLESGVAIGMPGEQVRTSRAVRRVIRYETIIVDSAFRRHVRSFFDFFGAGFAIANELLFGHFLAGASVSQSVLSKRHRDRMQPFEEVITVRPQGFTVVFTEDNRPVDGFGATPTSHAAATRYMEERVAADGGLARRVHVVPNTEVNIGS